MTVEELLFLIAIATIVTTAIQCIEMFMILRSQRQTNFYLENIGHLASDGVSQWIKDLIEDKQKQAEFFGFVSMCGQHAIGAAKDALAPKMPKIKSLGDFINTLLQMPVIQQKVEQKAAQILEGTAQKAVETVPKEVW